MSFFAAPFFGSTTSNREPQGYGSPKPVQTYQPIPAVGTPAFGGLGRPMTPKESSRHSSYTKDVEPTVQPIVPSLERPRRNKEYYLEGGDMYFLVENYLFRVHRYFFERESPVFRKQFADSAVNGNHRLGSSDADPLVLHEVTVDDFSRFLWVFYNPIYSIYDATAEDWAAILGLAHHWQFSEVKCLVVRELEKQVIPSIYKIVIYHRYDVDRGLLLPSYTDLVSREETLNFDEAKDLGLETSLMIMTAREIVRKGDSPVFALRVSKEELRNIIRHVFRFPELRSDSPFSDVTAAEPASDHRSPPIVTEKTNLPSVPENENEPITFTASASLNSPLPPTVAESTPIISAPTPPVPTPSTQNNQASSKPTPVTPKKGDTKPATVSPQKDEPKPKDEPVKTTTPAKKDESKPNAQEPVQPQIQPKAEIQEEKKSPFALRLANATKGAGSPTTTKDKDGDKQTDNKEAKDAKDIADTKDAAGPPATGQDLNGTPGGTPLLNQGTDQPGTPIPGQSLSEKKLKTLLAQAGKTKRTKAKEAETSSSTKGKETIPESLKVLSTTNHSAGSELGETVPGAKVAETKAGGKGKGKKTVAGDEEKGEEKPANAVDVDELKGNVKTGISGDEKKGDAGQDTKKSGNGIAGNIPPDATADNATNPVAANINAAANSETPTTTTDKKDNAAKKEADSTTKKETTGPSLDGKTAKPKAGVESVIAEEGDITTPKRVTKELPASPAKPLKEKLGLMVPESSKNGSAPTAVTDCTLSPLQKALKDAEDETLMERMARLKIVGGNYQPPKDVAPPAQTDVDSGFDGETAPSTPRSRAGRGSFSLTLHADVPMSDDDEFFLDCDSASISNFGGL